MTNKGYGMLYICPTPIGNLKDVTLRTLEVLKTVDLIACEDTRDSAKFLTHYDIHTSLTSYHDHNRKEKGKKIISLLMEGKDIALISDAGMPGISDPGEDLIRECINEEIEYTVLPGASAGIVALVGSGISTRRYVFEGFIPKTGKERKEILEDIKKETRTVVVYESPHNLLRTLNDFKEMLDDRPLTISRELTKKFEERIYTTTKNAIEDYGNRVPKGEYVLILGGRSNEDIVSENIKKFDGLSITEHISLYESRGIRKNDAMKEVAKDLGIKKRDVYQRFLEEGNNG